MRSTPSSPDQALATYRVDVARAFAKVRSRLVQGCAREVELKPVALALKSDVMEAVVFKRACEWLESRGRGSQAPEGVDLDRRILFHTSQELGRRHLGHLVSKLAAACRQQSTN